MHHMKPSSFIVLPIGCIMLSWGVLGLFPISGATVSTDTSDALAWYDTLEFPDAKNLPYVRVATGLWTQVGNQPRENQFVEGFLVRDEPDAFTVFICSVSDFKNPFISSGPYPELTTVRFVRKSQGPAYSCVDDEILDFKKVSSEVLDRVRKQASQPEPYFGPPWGEPISHRARIFAFARACLQKSLSETGSALMNITANISDNQSSKVSPKKIRELLQQQIGDTVLAKAEDDCANPSISWAELLKTYEDFDKRFPANNRIAYAREATEVLRKMIPEDAVHQSKPLEQMSSAEQVAENIYQLRNLHEVVWTMYGRYPDSAPIVAGKRVMTPVDRLVDLDQEAIPQLIAALDDRRFTRSLDSRSMQGRGPILRVGDIAQIILEHMSGRNFYPVKTDDGKLVKGTTRQQAEAWWAEVQEKGEKQVLIDATASGGVAGCAAARKLVEKYPDAAINAIEAGFNATTLKGVRSEYVEAASDLPGNAPVAFLKSKLALDDGLYSQVAAAKALNARGEAEAVPAMIEAWRKVQPRLSTNESDAYSEVGGLITFLAKSGNAAAIEALAHDLQKAPVDVRLAVVEVFRPFSNAGSSSTGIGVQVDADMTDLPTGEAGVAIERLLISALKDSNRRVGMQGTIDDASYKDPRVCDMAALVLSKRWPDKYHFHWSANATECDAQIAKLRDRWRSENGPSAQPL